MTQNNVGIYASQISGHLWAPNGSYDALATVTVPSGGVSSVTFAGIPQGYKHLQIRYIAKSTRTGAGYDSCNFQFNSDTGSNYSFHEFIGDGRPYITVSGNANTTAIEATMICANYSGQTSMFGSGIVDILDYASNSKFKTTKALGGYNSNTVTTSNVEGFSGIVSGSWRSTNPITSIKFYAPSGNLMEFSSFALYGVK
jgi:hypothetical protein